MKITDILAFSVRVIAFLVTYFFMLDYLFMCNIQTHIGATTTIIGIFIISVLYYPLRGKYLKHCNRCGNTSAKTI
jgi:uncharacterized RDD family membrane protein YckC